VLALMPRPALRCRGRQPTAQNPAYGRVPDVDDDQLAALRRLRAAFGAIQIIEVISNDPLNEASMADPRRMTPEEHGEAHALLVKAVSDLDWQATARPWMSCCAS
jgi:hypothetical protein